MKTKEPKFVARKIDGHGRYSLTVDGVPFGEAHPTKNGGYVVYVGQSTIVAPDFVAAIRKARQRWLDQQAVPKPPSDGWVNQFLEGASTLKSGPTPTRGRAGGCAVSRDGHAHHDHCPQPTNGQNGSQTVKGKTCPHT